MHKGALRFIIYTGFVYSCAFIFSFFFCRGSQVVVFFVGENWLAWASLGFGDERALVLVTFLDIFFSVSK